jgi:hypothetical protein
MRHLKLALSLTLAALGGLAHAAPLGFIHSELPVVLGAIDEDLVSHVVYTHHKELRTCYEAGLERNEALRGMVTIKVVIGDDGVVVNAEVKQSNLGDEEVEGCIVDEFYNMDFPVPQRGKAIVNAPFTFQPL